MRNPYDANLAGLIYELRFTLFSHRAGENDVIKHGYNVLCVYDRRKFNYITYVGLWGV